jgi:hypothetical protein
MVEADSVELEHLLVDIDRRGDCDEEDLPPLSGAFLEPTLLVGYDRNGKRLPKAHEPREDAACV